MNRQFLKHLGHLAFLLLTLSACLPAPEAPQAEGEVRLHFIDVGQGDSILIQGTTGQTVLYDGGRSDDDALSYLKDLGISKLDLVIASHADADHIGGLDKIIDTYQPRFFMDNGLPSTTQTYRGLLESVQAAGSQLLEPAGQSISLGEASLRIIPPPKDASLGDNNNSIGIIIDLGEFEAALTGDAENKEFSWWLNHSEFLQEVEIYKASHHGSKNGDSEASVSTFSPEVVVISASLNNPYGHPSAEALSLYQAIGATVFRTDLDGSIIITGRADGTYSVVSGGE